MEQYDLSKELLEVKVRDYELNSGMLPKKARILSKLFAQALGKSAGKVISAYDNMYARIEEGNPTREVQISVRKDINAKSKVSVKFPFMQPKQARICGLVAMNYSGFFDNEVKLYSSLITDLKSSRLRTEQAPIEEIIEKTRLASRESPQKYGQLLQQKQQSIYDFGVLMGLVDDDTRLSELKGNMRERTANYFDKVIKMHKGGWLGISWPLPLKNFSIPIRDGLYRDTITHAIQEGVESDYGFALPEKALYMQMIDQLKETVKIISSKGNSFSQKWKVATALPTTMFFLFGMNAYADEASENVKKALRNQYLEAGVTAATTAYSLADDVSEFLTTWYTAFTTLI